MISLGCRASFLDTFKAQYAGELGELALGFGKHFGDVYSLDFMRGLARAETAGTNIETVALKNNFDLFHYNYDKRLFILYTGVAVYHVTGLKYQASRHNSYPESYYSLGSIRGLLYWGAKAQLDGTSPHQGYVEAGINDIWVVNYANNPETVNPFDYVSWGIGYAFLF